MKMNKVKLKEVMLFNPPENIKKGNIAKKISMEKLLPHTKKISGFENAVYSAGPKFRNDDTLLAKITPCLENGKTAFVDILDENEVSFGSSEFIVLRAIKNISDANYIYYLARSPKFRNRAIGCMEGTSGRKRVNEKTLQNETFDIPPISTQSAIACVLSSLDDKIELNNKINKELENMAKTVYEYWFVQNGDKRWEKVKLEELIEFSRGISYTSKEIQKSEGLPMINLASVDISRNYKPDGIKIFSGNYKKGKIVKKWDMLIACTDLTQKADIIGSPVFVPSDFEEYVYSTDLAKINIIDNEVDKFYLYETLRTNIYHDYIKQFASGTTVKHLNLDGVKWYQIQMPTKNIQNLFSNVVKPIREKQFINNQESFALAQLRDFLLPLLMNGQVGMKDVL